MASRETAGTRERIVSAAVRSFAGRGFEATSLDVLADGLGIRKQTVLYHFGTKEGLLGAVIDQAVTDLGETLQTTGGRRGTRPPVAATVDAVLRLGARRPELLELLREVVRLGPPASTRLTDALAPLLAQATAVVPERTVLAAYAMVIGMATEVEVLRSLGVEPDLASLRRRRRQLLDLFAPP